VKDVLIRHFKNFHDNEFGEMMDKETDPLFARNPFLLKGEEWREKRAEITPAFTTSRLKALYPLIEDVQGRMIKYIEEQIKLKQAFDARELSAKFTTDVVSNAIFGIDAHSFTKEKPEIREMGRRLMAPVGTFIMKMFIVTTFPIMKKVINMRFTQIDIEKFFIDLMNQALKYREDNKVQREDFLDYLIQLRDKKNIQNIDMAAHTISFFTDGFETSSIAIAHALYEVKFKCDLYADKMLFFSYFFQLGRNKQAQDKLRVEVEKHCDKNGNINFEALGDMPYLDAVWNESLRLHPPATFTSRKCTEEIKLNFEGQTVLVEKEMNVYIPIHQLHYDSDYYDEPEKFIPERFDAENGGLKAFKERGVFLPFGDGPR
jgi:cytochrome P450